MANILYVVDEPSLGQHLEETLARAGHRAQGSRSVAEALQLLTRESCDLIVASHQLPGLTGIEFLSLLRREGYDTPLIMLTDEASAEQADTAIEAGAISCVTTPLRAAQVALTVEQALEFARLRRENELLRRDVMELRSAQQVIGESMQIRRILQTVAMVTSQASGDLFYANGASSIARLGIGAAGKILRSTGSAPAWEGMRGAQVSRGASQSIPNASYTAASFPSETFDTAAFWAAGNPSRITIPRTGYYLIGGKIGWDANSNGVREVKLYRNGVDDDKKSVSQAALNGIATRMDLCFLVDATAGEYFELFLWQNSGGSLNHGGDTSYFWIFDVGI
jgi:CheY-like chemotaxis protein